VAGHLQLTGIGHHQLLAADYANNCGAARLIPAVLCEGGVAAGISPPAVKPME
jgi:hypothetical protein